MKRRGRDVFRSSFVVRGQRTGSVRPSQEEDSPEGASWVGGEGGGKESLAGSVPYSCCK